MVKIIKINDFKWKVKNHLGKDLATILREGDEIYFRVSKDRFVGGVDVVEFSYTTMWIIIDFIEEKKREITKN